MKRALVTGASKGIGEAIVKKLTSNGIEVVGIYNSTAPKELEGASFIKCNLADRYDINKMIKTLSVKKFDYIVNCAGVVYMNEWGKLNYDEWEETLAVNLTAPMLIIDGLYKSINQGGAIVNITSVDADCAAFDTIAYAASKAGLVNLTKSMAANLGQFNVRVNAISPGWVETDMVKDTMPPESSELTPLKRNAQPEEIANVVNFLLGDQSSFINGEVIAVDGGSSVVDYTLFKEWEQSS